MVARVIPELDPSRDLGVIKTNGTFTGTFTTSVSGNVTISYGDGTEETSNNPSHTFSSLPPYILNIKDIDRTTLTGVTISGGDLTALDISRFKNLDSLNIRGTRWSASEINSILLQLDELGTTGGTFDASGYLQDDTINTTLVNSLSGKGWTLRGFWTPTDPATIGWYDASDTSTIFLNILSPTQVSRWSDKSGNGYDLEQTVDTRQPETGVRTINNLNAFDHVEGDWFETDATTSFATPSGGNIAFFQVVEIDQITNGNDAIISFDFVAEIGEFIQLRSGGSSQFDGRLATLDETVIYSDGPFSGPSIFGGILDWGNSLMSGFVDGDEKGSAAYTVQQPVFDRMNVMTKANNRAQHVDGACGEVIVTADISQETRQKIEGYLAWKWGLQSNLPITHPYKNYAP